jgi:LPXTG-site transpeptidase (sortase) family protein
MRRLAFALMAVGCVIALAGGSLGLAGWTGQQSAKALWADGVTGFHDATGKYTRLSFPAHHADFIVRDGASVENLMLGPARLEWSSIPGDRGNSVIAGHRDTHFRILKDLKKGDIITLERDGHAFQYRIVTLEIVRPTDNTFYQPTSKAVLTLVTCYPFYYLGPAPKRFIVRAELLDTTS